MSTPSFEEDRKESIASLGSDQALKALSNEFLKASAAHRYSYNFDWLGRPIIQYPQDIVAWQELIWTVKPDLVLETGIAHGGSLILSASVLAMLDYADAVESGRVLDPQKPARRVLGIDIDIRAHNRAAIEAHPMRDRIDMIEGSSIDPAVVEQVHGRCLGKRVLISLDSNHTHEHVLAELEAYAPLTAIGSYCVVFDTAIEDVSDDAFPDRPWGPGDNPKTAALEYLKHHPEFQADLSIDHKLSVSVAPNGYLRRIR